MHKIKGNSIRLTRGDSLVIQLNIQRNGEEYTPAEGDVIRFALKHNTMKPDRSDYQDNEPLLLKVIPNDTKILTIMPNDTKGLAFGDYVYDMEITFEDGSVDTFIAEQWGLTREQLHRRHQSRSFFLKQDMIICPK